MKKIGYYSKEDDKEGLYARDAKNKFIPRISDMPDESIHPNT